ncbi:MAG: Ig-like domain-containing protein [Methylococcales bacterium]
MNTIFIKSGSIRICIRAVITGIHLALLGWLLTTALIQPIQAANVPGLTLVSLTFDDGRDQSVARDILANYGMKGTFYVNSDRIDSGGSFLTKVELDALNADGHEIGGHTIGHVNLATLSDIAQQAAICNDMQTLVNWYGPIHSFAYPFSSTGPTTQSIMEAGCPGIGTYESARAVGGLVSGTNCQNCPWSETFPPSNTYYISTNNSVISTTTLNDLKSYVIQAETNGGGWVPLVFHRICDGCSALGVSPAILNNFLTWLEARETEDTYVRTVHQVMTGDFPPPPPPPPLGPNLLINPSLEIDLDNNSQADCWRRYNFGSNSANWTHMNDPLNAHSGSFSELLTITSYSSGDRKLLPILDAGQSSGGCTPNVADGEIYQYSAWYKTTGTASPILFYRDAGGQWQYWRNGPQLPTSTDWTQMIYYPGEAPAGAQSISFGIALESNGTLTTDDYSIAKVLDNPPPIDTTPPTILSFAPANGAIVSDTVTLIASATDNVGVQRVEFLINGGAVATDTTDPYAFAWNSQSVANGAATYAVRVVDFAGNETVSEVRSLTVNNDLSPPVVSFVQPPTPSEAAIVAGLLPLEATASDDVGVTRVDFMVNGSVVGFDNATPYQTTWNSLLTPNGPANLTAKAYDAAGNTTQTNPVINVTVNNQEENLVNNPSLEIDDSPIDNIADCWQRGGFGSNSFIWTRLNGATLAHSGNFAESLQVTSISSGDRKLVQRQDSSTCAPAVTEGARYTLSLWYKSTISTGFVVFYRNSSGIWTYWQTSTNFAAATDWTEATYTTPPMPNGATALSFGLYLNNVGTLVVDDGSATLSTEN